MKTLGDVAELTRRFHEQIDSYSATTYNETQVRREFVDPFFKALGWDVDNTQGYAEAYKDVIHEDAIKVGGATKAPDYCFRIGGVRKFFVETKKPSVNLKDDISPAFQIRRYAWSAKLPLSILTDFEEFAVYDCRQKPSKTDKASKGRILYLRYDEYESKWAEIAAVFSKEAILKGSFDKYAESAKGKKGTSEVDNVFLEEIERWRDLLARNIALRNPDLSQRELNFAVQRTIDRIVFLRICEDRGIEHYATLQALLNGEHVYERMRQNFRKADEVYNSGLFHFRDEKGRAEPPDTLTLTLKIDDKPLKDIIRNLYYPESPYEFSVLPADILGQVYERFLGSVIRLTKGHQAKVEEKPEVKKAGGVFYTPTYIVDYIVKKTIGTLVEGKSPRQIASLRFLDPACGSGTFLIQAYQLLLDYHRNWYINDGTDKNARGKNPKLTRTISGEWRLSTQERKNILLNNIHGVDIDSQAVEVTKLSLLLKVLEGENEQSLAQQLSLFHERALPDLEQNIKCGNSLIAHDYYNTSQPSLFDDDKRLQLNAFDWTQEFPRQMSSGGFHAVIGNPPYVLIGSDKPEEQEYYRNTYRLSAYKINTYVLFLEKGLNLLLPKIGMLGYIIPKSLVFNTYFEATRLTLLESYQIPQIIEISDKVFENAEVGDSILFFAQNTKPGNSHLMYTRVKNIYPEFEILAQHKTPQKNLSTKGESNFYPTMELKLGGCQALKLLADISNGLNPGNVRHILLSNSKSSNHHKKMVLGKDIQRFGLNWSGTWVNYDPSLKSKLSLKDIKSKPGMTAQKKVDFALRSPEIFAAPKILVRKTADKVIAVVDEEGFYFDSLAYGVTINDSRSVALSDYYFLAGVLNSEHLNSIHESISMNKGKVFAKVLAKNLSRLPVPSPTEARQHHRALYDSISGISQRLHANELKKQSQATLHEQTVISRETGALSAELDKKVAELYEKLGS